MRYPVFLSLCMLCFITVNGQEGPKNMLGRGNPVAGEKDSINIYLNFQDVYGLDLKNETFGANFYTVMESNGKDASKLQYLNGDITNKYYDTTRKPYYEAWNFGEFRIRRIMNYKDYPLDKQCLDIVVEAGEPVSKTILYTSGKESNLIDKAHLEGWRVTGITATDSIHTYTHFDHDNVDQHNKYSRVIFTIMIERTHKWLFLLKLFFPSLISLLILMIGFLIPSGKIETRFGLGVASIFGVISSLILIQQNLPETARLTLIEILNYIAIITVFVTLVIFAASYKRHEKGKNNKKFERIAFCALIFCYAVASMGILFLRS